MPIDRKIFISATTQEFEKDRDYLLHALSSLTVEVRTQESLKSTGGTTFSTIDDYIRAADYVVHLAGGISGSSAPKGFVNAMFARYPDMLMRLPDLADASSRDLKSISYTQWEANLALLHKKKLFCFAPARVLTSFRERSWLGDPTQRDHINRLKLSNIHPTPFDDINHLLALVAIQTNQLYAGDASKAGERIDPYLVNRTRHLGNIFDCISPHPFFHGTTVSNIAPNRHPIHPLGAAHLFVIPGNMHEDAPDAFIRRLTGHEGPSLVGATGERDALGWVDCPLTWPSDATPTAFADAFLTDNRRQLLAGIAKAVKRVQPVCFHNDWVGIDEHRLSLDFIRAWVGFWGEHLGALTKQVTGKDVSNFGLPIMAFLLVDLGRAGKRPYRLPFLNRKRDLSRDVENIAPEMARTFPTVTFRPLGRLPKINVQDARDWLRQRVEVSQHGWPHKRIEQMEKEEVFPLSIRAFADLIYPL